MTLANEARAVSVGSELEVELDSGTVVRAQVLKVSTRPPSDEESVRRTSWSRWVGTPEDLIRVVEGAAGALRQRSGDEPHAHVTLLFGKENAEEHYSEIEKFKTDFKAFSQPGAYWNVKDLRAIRVELGPAGAGKLSISLDFQWVSPAVILEVKSNDRVVTSGLQDSIRRDIAPGKRRIPSLNQFALFAIGGLLGIAYGVFISSLDFSFLPDNRLGDIIFALLYLSGFLGLIYTFMGAVKLGLPPMSLVKTASDVSKVRQWTPMVLKSFVLPLVLALIPLIVKSVFFS